MNAALSATVVTATVPPGVTCGWCGKRLEARPDLRRCTRCSGPLPTVPEAAHPARPPDAPRPLYGTIRHRLFWSTPDGQMGLSITAISIAVLAAFVATLVSAGQPGWGMGVALVCGVVLPFVAVGSYFVASAWRSARRMVFALEHGAIAEGELVRVTEDDTFLPSGRRHPRTLEYAFEVDGVRRVSTSVIHDASPGRPLPGDAVWVLYDPAKPTTTAVWPPVT